MLAHRDQPQVEEADGQGETGQAEEGAQASGFEVKAIPLEVGERG